MMRGLLVVCVGVVGALGVRGAWGQSIDFETLPDGSATVDRQLISDQYVADFGVRFDLVDPVTLEVVGSPQIAKVGGAATAFQACGADTPNPGQGVGQSFLTDDGSVGSNVETLLVTYSVPVSQAAGVILDTDTRAGPTYEEWTIEALDASMQVLGTVVITAPDGPDVCNGGQGPGDGAADSFLFQRASADISYLVLRYTGTATSIGLAFDSFSPTTIPPGPSIVASVPDVDVCAYGLVELGSEVSDGLARYLYQWEKRLADGSYVEIENAVESTLEVSAVRGETYRVRVTDVLAREAVSDPVTIGSTRHVDISVAIETAAGSGVFVPAGSGLVPFSFVADIETTYGWTSAEEFYHGADPALAFDRSHLFLSAAPGGLSLVTVHDGVGANGGGFAEMRMEFDGVAPGFVMRDDPTGDSYRTSAGSTVFETRHGWVDPNTDGWAIGALEGSWRVDVSFANGFTATPDLEGLSSWSFLARSGVEVVLPLEMDRRVRITASCGCSAADLNTDGVVDFFDISVLLSGAVDYNGDTSFDFFDISAFLQDLSAGCP